MKTILFDFASQVLPTIIQSVYKENFFELLVSCDIMFDNSIRLIVDVFGHE